jgi:hypothetical protein
MERKYIVKLEMIRDELRDAKKWSEVERVEQMLEQLLDEVE